MTKHPITPPPELVLDWIAQVWHEGTPVRVAASDLHVATQAARWGADKMLEAEPHEPTDEEVLKLAKHHSIAYTLIDGSVIHPLQEDTDIREEVLAFAHDLLARWGRPAPAPIPVAERLPGPGEVNDEREAWIEEPPFDYPLGDTGDYDTEPGRWVLRPIDSSDVRNNRRWLPHWALPLPANPVSGTNS